MKISLELSSRGQCYAPLLYSRPDFLRGQFHYSALGVSSGPSPCQSRTLVLYNCRYTLFYRIPDDDNLQPVHLSCSKETLPSIWYRNPIVRHRCPGHWRPYPSTFYPDYYPNTFCKSVLLQGSLSCPLEKQYLSPRPKTEFKRFFITSTLSEMAEFLSI